MWHADKNTLFSNFVTRAKNNCSAEEANITTISFIIESANGIIRLWTFPYKFLPHIIIPYKKELK